MSDREKVIKGLEETEIMLSQAIDRGGEMAAIGAFKCLNRVSAAIVLLKEQDNCENCAIAIEDRQPVVRCKDCKWYQEGIDIDGNPFTRCNGNVRVYGHTKPNWFCADGERR